VTLTSRPAGPRALLVEVDDARAALSLATWAREAGVAAEEIVPGAVTVLFDGVPDPDRLAGALAGWRPGDHLPAGELVEVPVTYDGPDLDFVAESWGIGRDEGAARHAEHELVAAFCGFAPGFAYLAGLPEELGLPRLDSPRSRVPAGSVGIGGPWCGIYPTESPGGWRLLGRTETVLWEPTRDRPALLAPGTRVRFVPA
jgi:KipI family sensor histidine kinase inhibitor